MSEHNDTLEKMNESDEQYFEKVNNIKIQNDSYPQAILENTLDILDSVEDTLSKIDEINKSISANKDRLDAIDESIGKIETEAILTNNKLLLENKSSKEIINLLEKYYINLDNKINILEKNFKNSFNQEKNEILYSELKRSTAELKAIIEENSLKSGLITAVDNAFSTKIKDLNNILEELKNNNLNIKNYINNILEKNNKKLEEKIENKFNEICKEILYLRNDNTENLINDKFDKLNKELSEIKNLLKQDSTDEDAYSYLSQRISKIDDAFEKIVLFLGNG